MNLVSVLTDHIYLVTNFDFQPLQSQKSECKTDHKCLGLITFDLIRQNWPEQTHRPSVTCCSEKVIWAHCFWRLSPITSDTPPLCPRCLCLAETRQNICHQSPPASTFPSLPIFALFAQLSLTSFPAYYVSNIYLYISMISTLALSLTKSTHKLLSVTIPYCFGHSYWLF